MKACVQKNISVLHINRAHCSDTELSRLPIVLTSTVRGRKSLRSKKRVWFSVHPKYDKKRMVQPGFNMLAVDEEEGIEYYGILYEKKTYFFSIHDLDGKVRIIDDVPHDKLKAIYRALRIKFPEFRKEKVS